MFLFNILLSSLISSSLLAIVAAVATQAENNKGLLSKSNILPSAKPVGNKIVKFPYYVSGYDYDERPVIVMEWGRWDIRSMADKGGEDINKFDKGVDDFLDLLKAGFFNKKSNESEEAQQENVEVVGVIDFEGLNLRQIGTPASMSIFVRNLAKIERCYAEFAYGFLLNANPLVNQVISLSKPYMGNFLQRCEIYGTNARTWIPKVLRKIPRSQLHSAYGGKKDFRPVAVYSVF